MLEDEIIHDTEKKPFTKPTVIRNATDLQRLKVEKLMKHPEKPMIISEKAKERGVPVVPEFVRNVMGSSAGAGSGEFHVYRHLRRKEYARQKYMKERGEREKLEDEYHQKLEENKKKLEEKTAKKRAKRLKKKAKMKGKFKKPKIDTKSSQSEEESKSESESDESDKEDASKEFKEKSSNKEDELTSQEKVVEIKEDSSSAEEKVE